MSPQELEELYDMRELLESYAAERAARMADTAQLGVLRRVCDEFAGLVKRRDFERWLDAPENRRRLSTLDREFHTTILAAANNRVARRFFENAQILSLVVSWNFMKTDSATLAAQGGQLGRAGSRAEVHAAGSQRRRRALTA